ncbi:MAG: hypothetical protein AB4372_05020 [Xenococcus sp. (in: cyanobacteria)]
MIISELNYIYDTKLESLTGGDCSSGEIDVAISVNGEQFHKNVEVDCNESFTTIGVLALLGGGVLDIQFH